MKSQEKKKIQTNKTREKIEREGRKEKKRAKKCWKNSVLQDFQISKGTSRPRRSRPRCEDKPPSGKR